MLAVSRFCAGRVSAVFRRPLCAAATRATDASNSEPQQNARVYTPPEKHLTNAYDPETGTRLRRQKKKALKLARKNRVKLEPMPLMEAIKYVKEKAVARFVEGVDIDLRLRLDPRKVEQNLRGSIAMPCSVGKVVRVVVFATGQKAEEAKSAGATVVGAEDLVEQIKGGFLDFERCIATPDMMPHVGKIARILGPRGLMPNPKLGTVTNDVAEAIKASSTGVPYRVDKEGGIAAGIGRVNLADADLKANIYAFIKAIAAARPKGIKDPYFKSFTLSSTMGPGVPVDIKPILVEIGDQK